jgi:hypothetical protein
MRWHCKTVHEKVRAHACIYCPEGVAFGEMGHLNTHIDTVTTTDDMPALEA